MFVYRGGKAPESHQEAAESLDAWGSWLASLGAAVIDPGKPFGLTRTVHPDGSFSDNGRSNPPTGYSLIEARNIDAAVAKAKDCPILAIEGSIEVAEVIVI
jgi:hypothetical protein